MAGREGIHAFLLGGRRGPLLALYYEPQGAAHPLGDILVVPPFGEEMNRCRSMVSVQARALASIGIGTLVLDPYGTGDSSGDFSEATWEQWREDLRAGIDWLRAKGRGCQALWGLRIGALLASQLAAEDPHIRHLLFWQPVLEGKAFFTQFLRIRLAAELEQSGGIKSTDQLRKMAAAGEIIEVGGYRVNGQLARAVDEAKLPELAQLQRLHVAWFEVLPAPDSNVGRASQKIIEAWQGAGLDLQFERVVGPSFWQVHEREVAPALLEATTQRMSALAAAVSEVQGGQPTTGAAIGHDGRTAPPEVDPGAAAEYPVLFQCNDAEMVGIVHRGKPGVKRGVVIVVAGGPQYRAGAHRQFVSLARKLAQRGHPVLRFDLRGMGDSHGEHRGFQHSEADIRAAIDALLARNPELTSVVLLGECESASGILFYAFRDARAQGLVLVNPWVRTEGGRAEVIIKHYYVSRLFEREFWRKVASGKLNVLESARSLVATCAAYFAGRKLRRQTGSDNDDFANLPLPVKTAVGLRRFRGPALVLMSGRDYIAREFDEVVKSSQAWNGLLAQPRITRRDVTDADHTFSREEHKRQVQEWVCDWVASW